jgi:hypothetical protein
MIDLVMGDGIPAHIRDGSTTWCGRGINDNPVPAYPRVCLDCIRSILANGAATNAEIATIAKNWGHGATRKRSDNTKYPGTHSGPPGAFGGKIEKYYKWGKDD